VKNRKCQSCKLVSSGEAPACPRCGSTLLTERSPSKPSGSRFRSILIRVATCVLVCMVAIFGFYFSLLLSAEPLNTKQRSMVMESREIVRDRGFTSEALLLDHLTIFRASDNWLNSSVPKENAYAATNFPFGIITIYPDFFTYPVDATERAAVLLHEACHLRGAGEEEAYEFVWRNRDKLGWTRERYFDSPVWKNVRRQTREYVPKLFTCTENEFADCTESPRPPQ
jgi:hypothetical protein